jgi:hypothetical protein
MAARQLSDGNDDGTCIGQSSTDKVGFYGTTPVVQQALIADATDSATAITTVNSVIDVLVAVGLIKSA